ncbi:unnamed protein product [Clonostachys solani]|uniref:Clr5 domain-containing protein n=1 Tax=Clonostachys solani TaxID=160281 RepID=A0A9N9W7D3_9HYPO|nr:unnamed protein product [Clonostachys solani]
MASSSKEIPLEVWERHKDTILGLRFHEGLPLDSVKTSSRNVVQVMRDEHQFEATTAQYEAQLKKWKAAKYLKRQDWEALLPLYSTLERQGLKPRVRLGDQILEQKRIEKARRRYLPAKNRVLHESNELPTSAQGRLWRLEVWRHGQFSEYSGQEGEPSSADTLPSAVFGPGDANMDIEELPLPDTLVPAQSDPIWTANQFEANTPSSQLTIFHPPLYSPQPDPETLSQMTSYFMRQGILSGSPFAHLDASVALSSRNETDDLVAQYEPQLVLSDEHTQTMLRCISQEPPCLASDTLLLPNYKGSSSIYNSIPPLVVCQNEARFILSGGNVNIMIQSILQEPSDSICMDLENTTVQTVSEQIESLLRDGFFEGECPGKSGAVSGTISMSEIHGRILLSIANNFSGLEGVPCAIVLGILKSSSQMTVDVVKYLQSGILSISKPLADNLFRAAVEAGDYDLVDMILKTTHGQANEIDVNGIVCQLHGKTFTALSLASYLHQPAIVRMLIDYGAKVHVPGHLISSSCALTSLYQEYWARLEKSSRCPKNAAKATEIARLLLDSEPNAVVRLLEDDFFTTPCQLLEVLVQAVPPEYHHELFSPQELGLLHKACGRGVWRLGSIVEKMRPPAAAKVIKGLLAECKTTKCARSCVEKSSKDLNCLLTLSITEGSIDLAKYLLEHTRPTMGNLSAAIRGGQQNIVSSMLEQGADTNGGAVCLKNMSHLYGDSRECGEPTTPLAEAIRSQNRGLVRYLEENGALDRISNPSLPDLEAAVIATVQGGNLPYLEQLLALVPPNNERNLEGALVKAIELRHVKIVDRLMVYLAAGDHGHLKHEYAILQTAIEIHDESLVHKTIKYFGTSTVDTIAIAKAIRWGDMNIVKFLIEMKPTMIQLDDPEMTLGTAIENGNVELATLLLDWGTHPSGLQKAIEVGSSDMARLLLTYSADPADEDAFSLALHAPNTSLLNILSDAFALSYPNGIKGFGGKALVATFDARDISTLEFLIGLNLDVNSTAARPGSKYDYTTILLYAIESCGKYDPVGNEMISQLLKAGAWRGRQPLLVAIKSNNLQIVKLLLANGFNINQPTLERLSRTPLQQACEIGNFQMVEYLVDQGAEVNDSPAVNGGGTALQLAAISGNVRVVRLLLDKEADIHADPAPFHGRTALEGAAEHGRISVLNILLEKGANGYSMDAIEKAKSFAEKQKQRGCEERLKQALFRAGAGVRGSLCL